MELYNFERYHFPISVRAFFFSFRSLRELMIEKPNLLHLKSFLIKFSFYQIGKRSLGKLASSSFRKQVHANAVGGIYFQCTRQLRVKVLDDASQMQLEVQGFPRILINAKLASWEWPTWKLIFWKKKIFTDENSLSKWGFKLKKLPTHRRLRV